MNVSLMQIAATLGWAEAVKVLLASPFRSVDYTTLRLIAKAVCKDEEIIRHIDGSNAPIAQALQWIVAEVKSEVDDKALQKLDLLVAAYGAKEPIFYLLRAEVRYKTGAYDRAISDLIRSVEYAPNKALQDRSLSLLKKMEQNDHYKSVRRVRLALLGHRTTNFLARAIKYAFLRHGLFLEIYEPPYNSVNQEVLDSQSMLFEFKPDVVLFFDSWRDNPVADIVKNSLSTAQAMCQTFVQKWKNLRLKFSGLIIQTTLDIPPFPSLGLLSGVEPCGEISVIRAVNNLLMQAAAECSVTIIDHEAVSAKYGLLSYNSDSYWETSQQHPAPEALFFLARHVAAVTSSAIGLAKKVLVLDLDNTLWGGVIGEDGLGGIKIGAPTATGQSYAAFQSFVKNLKSRGVILAVCSKNNLEDAKLPFQSHESMLLRLDDISVFRANWQDKVFNIREIVRLLNVGLDSVVFVDDNPAERALVRTELPEVCVPELSDDPSEFVAAVAHGLYFETIGLSNEDFERSNSYVVNAKREELRLSSESVEEYLRNLQMKAICKPFVDEDVVRIVQLIGKTNQFNVTSRRHNESVVRKFMNSETNWTHSFRISDAYGDYGLVGVMIAEVRPDELDTYEIDTWLMSCRVIGRQVENLMLDRLVESARSTGIKKIRGLYNRSPKNAMVANLFERLGFALLLEKNETQIFELDVAAYLPTKVAIEVE